MLDYLLKKVGQPRRREAERKLPSNLAKAIHPRPTPTCYISPRTYQSTANSSRIFVDSLCEPLPISGLLRQAQGLYLPQRTPGISRLTTRPVTSAGCTDWCALSKQLAATAVFWVWYSLELTTGIPLTFTSAAFALSFYVYTLCMLHKLWHAEIEHGLVKHSIRHSGCFNQQLVGCCCYSLS